MFGTNLVFLAIGFWLAVVAIVLLFKHLKRHPDQAAHYATLFRRLVG